MDYHKIARLTVISRERMAKKVLVEGLTLKQAAACFNVSAKTAAKWVRRYREHGAAGLTDHSSRPRRLRQPTWRRVEVLRRERWTGQRIAQHTNLSRATVSRILKRLKLSRMRDLEPKLATQRYEHAAAGDLLHLYIKKLGRIVRPSHRVTGDRRDSVDGAGWEYVHVAIDDHSRIAFSDIYPDEMRASASASKPCSRITDRRIDRVLSPRHAARWHSSTASPGLTPRAQTARPGGSSRPPCANGGTPIPIRTQTSAA